MLEKPVVLLQMNSIRTYTYAARDHADVKKRSITGAEPSDAVSNRNSGPTSPKYPSQNHTSAVNCPRKPRTGKTTPQSQLNPGFGAVRASSELAAFSCVGGDLRALRTFVWRSRPM
jgi:hypothetical protein